MFVLHKLKKGCILSAHIRPISRYKLSDNMRNLTKLDTFLSCNKRKKERLTFILWYNKWPDGFLLSPLMTKNINLQRTMETLLSMLESKYMIFIKSWLLSTRKYAVSNTKQCVCLFVYRNGIEFTYKDSILFETGHPHVTVI